VKFGDLAAQRLVLIDFGRFWELSPELMVLILIPIFFFTYTSVDDVSVAEDP